MDIRLTAITLAALLSVTDANAQNIDDVLSLGTIAKRVLSSSDPITTSRAPFSPLVSTVAFVPGNMTVLITARFTGESSCTEINSNLANWCEMRVLIDGVEANPQESQLGNDFAFDSTDTGNATSGNRRSLSMERFRCVTNSGAQTRQVPVSLEWGVTNYGIGAAPTFWLDDWTLAVEVSNTCREF